MHKRKKNNRNHTNQTNQSTHNSSLKPSRDTLEQWHNTYNALYDHHCSLVLSENGMMQVKNHSKANTNTTRLDFKDFDIHTQSIAMHPDAETLNDKLYQLATECQAALYPLIDNNLFCNDTLILYLKIIMLHGLFLSAVHMHHQSQAYYKEVLEKMKKYGHQLSYENDMEFQQAMEFVFSIVEIAGDTNWYVKLKNDFANKCSNTIVGLEVSYNALIDIHSRKLPGNTKKNPELEEKIKHTKNNFIFKADKLKKHYESMQQEGQLTTEFKLYFIMLNYLNVNVFHIAHPDRLFSVKKKSEKKFDFSIHTLPEDILFDKYLNNWRSLKKTDIDPAFKLIQSINANEFGMKFHGFFNNALKCWLSEFHMILTLFNSMIENWMKQIESTNTLTNESNETVKKYIVGLNAEKNILLEYVHVIRALLESFVHILKEETRLMSTSIYEKFSQCDNRINLIAEDLNRLEQEKIELAEKTSRELINEVDALREKKIRQYILKSTKKISLDEDYSTEDKEPSHNNFPLIKTITNPNVLHLQKLDEECFKLADTLQSKILANNKFLTERSTFNIPFPSTCQKEVMLHINGLLAEFYYLVSLFEKFDTFSKHEVIIKMDEVQEGITSSRTLFKQRAAAMHGSINTMLELMNTVILKQKQHREETIYKMGLDFAKQENLAIYCLSEDEIRRYGRNIFKQIGIHKSKNKMDVSEFTKLKDFMHTMRLSFSGFNYLQNKVFTLLENPLQKFGLFSLNQSELKKHELTPGIMEELIGIILKQHYEEFNNEHCGHQALVHFQQALEWYKTNNDNQSILQIRNRMDAIEKTLENTERNHVTLI